MNENIHGVSDHFSLQQYLDVRFLTIQTVESIAAKVEVGMTEADGLALIDQELHQIGVSKKWHPNKFRIGVNTIHPFKEKSTPNIKLKAEDLFFIDIGPILNGHEGDYGNTFTLGQNKEYLQIASFTKELFLLCSQAWKEEQLSGYKLYQYARLECEKAGFDLNPFTLGHRLGDFPHHLFFRGKLADIQSSPLENLWVLELLVLDKRRRFGAYFEDILQ